MAGLFLMLLCLAALAYGCFAWYTGGSVYAVMIAMISFLIAAVLLSATVIVGSIDQVRDELKKLNNKEETS